MGLLPSKVIREIFFKGGDLSSHPINDKMRRTVVEEGRGLLDSPTDMWYENPICAQDKHGLR